MKEYWYAEPHFPKDTVVIRSRYEKIPHLIRLSTDHQAGNNTLPKKVCITLDIENRKWPNPRSSQECWNRFGTTYANIEANEVYYYFRIGPLKFRLLIKDLDTNSPRLCFNPTYWRFPIRIGSLWHSRGHLLDVTVLKLLQQGHVSIHAGCIASSKGEAALIAAPSQTGKTMTVINAQKDGYGLLSDDITVSDGVKLMPGLMPGQILWSDSPTNNEKGLEAKFRRIGIRTVEMIGFDSYQPLVLKFAGTPIEHVYNEPARLKHIIFLSRGYENTIINMSKEEALRRLRDIQMAQFSWRFNPAILNYDYHTKLLDLSLVEETESELLSTLVNNSDALLQISSPNPADFLSLVKKAFPL